MNPPQANRCPDHIAVFVRERHMGLEQLNQPRMPGTHRRNQSRHLRQSPNVDIIHSAIPRLFSPRQIGEKSAVIFLHISVAMFSRGQHEIHVALQPNPRIIFPSLPHHPEQLHRQPKIQRILPRREELVIMNTLMPPVLSLLTKDIPPLV